MLIYMIKRLVVIFSFILLFAFFPSSVTAQSCSAPAVASGVIVEYPGCNGSSCDLAQASCSWTSQADASSYNVTVTELETSTVIKNNESHPNTTTKILFNITQGRTYKCDVVSVASCGALAAAASDQLLCEADALIDTPTPTQASSVPTTAPGVPTAIPAPLQPIDAPGGLVPTVGLIGAILLVIVGGIVFLAL